MTIFRQFQIRVTCNSFNRFGILFAQCLKTMRRWNRLYLTSNYMPCQFHFKSTKCHKQSILLWAHARRNHHYTTHLQCWEKYRFRYSNKTVLLQFNVKGTISHHSIKSRRKTKYFFSYMNLNDHGPSSMAKSKHG